MYQLLPPDPHTCTTYINQISFLTVESLESLPTCKQPTLSLVCWHIYFHIMCIAVAHMCCRSAYLLFVADKRGTLPIVSDAAPTDYIKKLAELWKNLPGSEKQVQQFIMCCVYAWTCSIYHYSREVFSYMLRFMKSVIFSWRESMRLRWLHSLRDWVVKRSRRSEW